MATKTILREEATRYGVSSGWVTYQEFLELIKASEQRFELTDGIVYNLASLRTSTSIPYKN
ncbi:hypothetical protein ACE41H_00515 [Paenibacillus enshidis]|uniref:Uncharacterized protein n=1 Tax=Paenibacillus enshidis TaxID=1458439 RepID=A0ABV5AMQ6_9BACL